MKPPLARFILMAILLGCGTGWRTAAQTPPPAAPVPAAPVPAAPAASQGGPKIQFAESGHDFGKIEGGTIGKFDFVFTNPGTATLEVTDVRSSCGCTTTGAWSKKVEPGQRGTIPIEFNSEAFSGPIHKTVTVTSNVPAQALTILDLKATVWRPIEVNPPTAYFTPQAEGQTVVTKIVSIVNNTEAPLELSPPECGNNAFTAELKTLKAGKEFEVHISAKPPFRPGTVQGPITLKTSSKKLPVIVINGVVLVQSPITAMPPQLMLGPGPLAVATSLAVTVRNTGSAAVTVSEPTVDVPGAAATLNELQPGRVFKIMVNFPVGFQVKPTEPAELSVKTSHPQYPIVRVPIFQGPVAFPPQPAGGPPDPSAAGSPHGAVGQAIDVTPASVSFTPQPDATTAETQLVRIVNHTDEPLELSPPECSNNAFTAELRTLKAGKEFEVRVSVKPPFEPGTLQGSITLKTSSKTLPVITIDGIVVIQLPILAMPSQLLLEPAPLAAATKLAVILRNSGSVPVTVSEPAVNLPGVVATLKESQPGRLFSITLDFPAGFAIKATEHAELTVKTSHPQYPIVRVPIVQGPRESQPQAMEDPPQPATPTDAVPPP